MFQMQRLPNITLACAAKQEDKKMKRRITCFIMFFVLLASALPLHVIAEEVMDSDSSFVSESEYCNDEETNETDYENSESASEPLQSEGESDLITPELLEGQGLAPVSFAAGFQPRFAAYRIHKIGDEFVIHYYGSFNDAWIGSQQGDTVGLLKDADINYALVNSSVVTIELNGHKLCRTEKKGPILEVKGHVVIYGGRKNWQELDDAIVEFPSEEEEPITGERFNGKGLADENGEFQSNNGVTRLAYYKYNTGDISYTDNDAAYAVTGGLLCGGWNEANGGCISMKNKGNTVSLYNVTIAGNRADNSGGAVYMGAEKQTLNLINSNIMYNVAEDDDGGGIYVNNAYSTVRMTNSQIAFNIAHDNGGGIYVDSDHVSIIDNGIGFDPDNENHPSQWNKSQTPLSTPYSDVKKAALMSNDSNPFQKYFSNKNFYLDKTKSSISYNLVIRSDMNGGGGALCSTDDTTLIKGVNMVKNIVDSKYGGNGQGGALDLKDSLATISGCNIWKNYCGDIGGGVFLGYNTGSGFNSITTMSNCTVTDNHANGNGAGGVFVTDFTVFAPTGRTIIMENTSGKKNIKSNLFLNNPTIGPASYISPSLSLGANISISAPGNTNRVITNAPGDYNPTMFHSDSSDYHFEYNNDNRHLMRSGGSEGAFYKKVYSIFTPDNGSRTRLVKGKEYVTAKGTKYPLYEGIVTYPAACNGEDVTSKFFYSDGYFDNDPKKYDEHLATTSMELAAASFNANAGNEGKPLYEKREGGSDAYYPVKSEHVRQMLSDIGVKDEDIYINDNYAKMPGANTMGVAIGSKKVKYGGNEKNLVILTCRSGGYGQEWSGNLTIGDGTEFGGESKGFALCAEEAMRCLKEYLEQHHIDGHNDNTLFWVSGFSRGGATADLTSARIIGEFDTKEKRTFTYTFEAPQGGVNTARDNAHHYDSIHNVLNDSDIVPNVAPALCGFHRYGVDHYVPGNTKESGPLKLEQHKYETRKPHADEAKHTETFYRKRDNDPVALDDKKYINQRAKMEKHLEAMCGKDLIYSDYFHKAHLNYYNGSFLSNLDGGQILEEYEKNKKSKDYFDSAAKFNRFFFETLYKEWSNFLKDTKGNTGLYRESYTAPWELNTENGRFTTSTTIEECLSEMIGLVFSMQPKQRAQFEEMSGTVLDRVGKQTFFYDYVGETNYDENTNNLMAVLSHDPNINYTEEENKNYEDMKSKGYLFLEDILNEDQLKVVYKNLPTLIHMALELLTDDYNDTSVDNTNNPVIATIAYNGFRILYNHYEEVVISWLRSYDDFYDDETKMLKMDDSVLAKEVAAPKASVSLAEDGFKEVRMEVPNDINRGAGIFYSLDCDGVDRDLHPYRGAFKIPEAAQHGGRCILRAFAIHDNKQSETTTINLAEIGGADKFTSHSITLDSDVSLNFYTSIDKDTAATSTMTFRIGNRTVNNVKAQYNSEQKEYYFSCPVAPYEYEVPVYAILHLGDKEIMNTYCVNDYIQTIVGKSRDKNVVELAKRIADYGYFTKYYLNELHHWGEAEDIWNSKLNYGFPETKWDWKRLQNYKAEIDHGKDTNTKFVGKTISYDTSLNLNIYVSTKDGQPPVASCKGKNVSVKKQEGNTYIVSVEHILPTEFKKNFQIKINGMTVSCSVLAYCASVLNKYQGEANAATYAMAALYEYYLALDDYLP